ncbi:unnamed protein product [Caretta caretta]
MAAGNLAGSFQDEVTCSICLEYFTDPVTIECGHNFCRACISQCWGELEPNFSCPQCRETALQRDLRPHGQLGNLAELVTRLRLQAEPEPEGQRVGDRHQEALKLSCEEDQTPLCLMCDRSWVHRTHTVVPMEEATQEHREQILTRQQHLWEETEELLGLKSDWDKESERLLRQTEVERPLVVSKCEGLHQFLAEQERLLLAWLGELDEEIGRRREENATHLGEDISRLSALITELEGKRQQPVLELLQVGTLSLCLAEPPSLLLPLLLGSQAQSMPGPMRRCWGCSSLGTWILCVGDKWPVDMTLDPDMAHPDLVLSEDRKRVRCGDKCQDLPGNPERFDPLPSVLGTEGFTGGWRQWEVEVGDNPHWILGVCRESVTRKKWIVASPSNGYWAV